MDKERSRGHLSMKSTNSMDKDGFRGGLSMKNRLSMDREKEVGHNREDGDGMKIFCRFAA